VYTIHNLALQGIRPLTDHSSAFTSWFPGLGFRYNEVVDPRYHDCINPMAVAIRLADKINTVSPTYALEILEPDEPAHGFYGGEGLELDLQVAARQGRLVGILNGCDYMAEASRRPAWKLLRDSMLDALRLWISNTTHVHSAHYLMLTRITAQLRRKPAAIFLSVGRITLQKVGLFLQLTSSGRTALEEILDGLGTGELMVFLGNGDRELERALTQLANRHKNFVFLKGYLDELPDLLYRSADLFLMPSTFEPCGISQMLALRESVPCVVHGVGGLKDTIDHQRTGFVFDGDSPAEQADNFVEAVRAAQLMRSTEPERWQKICDAAGAARFSWEHSARDYARELYDDTNS
ncbi:MAG: glycosyltransferase, partial [Gammaproteobacteria bacterium]|nr:glycosyltransferase [Gammaproteobacteria bacterium]